MSHPVYIIGAGPGDPGLLTLRAHQLLTEVAEVVIYDRLIPDSILDFIPSHVERLYAGKSCRKHHMTQEEINAELLRYAKTGRTVVRLKGGDPFVFGRGGEEAEYLVQHGVPFEVVPGVTAASGIAARLGIPLTQRGMATSIHFLTGHQQKGEVVSHDWQRLADPKTTLVFYMGLANLREIVLQLKAQGVPGDTPAAVIQEGTMPTERVLFSTIDAVAYDAEREAFAPPTLVIIGQVVGMAKRLYP
ncbi:MAG: uroporphyrinogen-III C-methyltransferase [Hyphomicrobiales bacterium]|nr:uroporphyrinogen-III C-methyltransferase [Hyphomicrobiales bacterium]